MLHRQLENSGLLMVWSEKIINSKSDVQVKITVLYVLLWNIVIDIWLRLLCITSANFKFEQCLLVGGGRLEQAGMRAGGQNLFFFFLAKVLLNGLIAISYCCFFKPGFTSPYFRKVFKSQLRKYWKYFSVELTNFFFSIQHRFFKQENTFLRQQ